MLHSKNRPLNLEMNHVSFKNNTINCRTLDGCFSNSEESCHLAPSVGKNESVTNSSRMNGIRKKALGSKNT